VPAVIERHSLLSLLWAGYLEQNMGRRASNTWRKLKRLEPTEVKTTMH
jgi:hypothetical protein